MTATQFTSKLGTAKKAGERTRIWIEGQRLIDAGFYVGCRFQKVWTKHRLVLDRIDPDEDLARIKHPVATVSGKGEKPIIDIVGAKVAATFRTAHVRVTFEATRIIITEQAEAGR